VAKKNLKSKIHFSKLKTKRVWFELSNKQEDKRPEAALWTPNLRGRENIQACI
jgi:hypothetical protein